MSLTGDSLDRVIVFLALVFAVGTVIFRSSRRSPYPPGPRRFPVLGNVFNVPKSMDGKTFKQLCERFGDVVHLQLLGQHIIVLNSYEAASDILDKRAANYSDKPPSAMASLIGLEWNMALLRYPSDAWRQQRREMHRFMNGAALSQYHSVLEQQTQRLLYMIIEEPGAFFEHIRINVGSSITRIAYGLADDEHLSLAEEGAEIFLSAFTPGKFIVEMFPILKHIPSWFPGVRFRRQAAYWRERYVEVRNKPFEAAMAMMGRGGDDCSVSATMIRHAEDEGTASTEYEEIAKNVTAAIFLGGADTTIATVRLFFLAMMKFPAAQQAAQKELDAVVGPDRLPQFSDRASLPYVQGLIQECTRWSPILPLALPTTSVADDVYNGYRIPAKSTIIVNTWAITRDPDLYPDPERFAPERFLKNGQFNPGSLDPRAFVFGMGRRTCPGREFAEASLYIAIASLLHVFTIEPPLDDHGNPTVPDVKMTPGILSAPEPFSCRVRARSPALRSLISHELMTAVG
ncbi:CyP450 monooxygenase [Daedaleopsis nitida]|nr:CyP450 monooxygenase [Daedaleopsis nitida]